MHTRLVHECCVDRVDKGKRPRFAEAFSMSSTSLGLCMSGTHEHEADASFRERSGQRCYQSCELFSTTPVVFPAPSFFQSNVLATQHVGGDLPYRSLQNSPVRVGAQSKMEQGKDTTQVAQHPGVVRTCWHRQSRSRGVGSRWAAGGSLLWTRLSGCQAKVTRLFRCCKYVLEVRLRPK